MSGIIAERQGKRRLVKHRQSPWMCSHAHFKFLSYTAAVLRKKMFNRAVERFPGGVVRIGELESDGVWVIWSR